MTKPLIIVTIIFGISWAFPSPNKGRIIGGIEASLEDFPYMVNIHAAYGFRCGGTILSQYTIITAAHCTNGFTSSFLIINAGSLNIDKGVTHKVSRIIQHEDFDQAALNCDISLLILETPLEFTSSIQPIKFEREYVNGGNDGIATGWGMTSYPGSLSTVLLYLNAVTVDHKVCNELMIPSIVQEHQICAYSGSAGKGVCRGDSGGPLTVNGKLVGIISWVKEYCAKGAPDVYTRVSAFAEWIDRHIIT